MWRRFAWHFWNYRYSQLTCSCCWGHIYIVTWILFMCDKRLVSTFFFVCYVHSQSLPGYQPVSSGSKNGWTDNMWHGATISEACPIKYCSIPLDPNKRHEFAQTMWAEYRRHMETINTIEKRREDQSVISFFHFDFEYDSRSSPRLMTLVFFCLVFDYFVVKKCNKSRLSEEMFHSSRSVVI